MLSRFVLASATLALTMNFCARALAKKPVSRSADSAPASAPIVSSIPPTPEDPKEARRQDAKRYLDQAVAAYERGDHLAALADFQRAYALYPTPNLRFNIAQVLIDLGRDVEAIEAYESFLAEERTASADARATAKDKVAEIQRRIGRLAVRCTAPSGEIAVDGKVIGTSPIERTLRLPPGEHQVTAQREQSLPFVAPVIVKAGELTTLKVDFKSARPVWKRGWFWAMLSGVVVASTGVALAVVFAQPQPLSADRVVLQTGAGTTSAP